MARNSPTQECNALSPLSPEFQEWLNEEQVDLTIYDFDLGIGNTTPPTEETQTVPPAATHAVSDFSDQIASLEPANVASLAQFVPFEPAYTSSDMARFPDEIMTIDPAYITDLIPDIPTSQNVSGQNQGLETTTFIPSCISVSTNSPLQLLPPHRRYECEYESCVHKQFDRPSDLNPHRRTHHKYLECEFDRCQVRFSTEKDRQRHRECVHEKKEPSATTTLTERALGRISTTTAATE